MARVAPVVLDLVPEQHSDRKLSRATRRSLFPWRKAPWWPLSASPAAAANRRGQSIKPGVYTMRYSNNPVDGAHLGVAPQRDFLLLTPLANDPDPNAMPDFATLVSWSRKASGTPHPAVFSIETPAGFTFPDSPKKGITIRC